MQSTFETAFAAVQALAKDFEENRRHYLFPGYGHKCESIDRQIDALVYELYGLTDEEIAIVEGDQ